jgi:hypothetical protein
MELPDPVELDAETEAPSAEAVGGDDASDAPVEASGPSVLCAFDALPHALAKTKSSPGRVH